MTGTPRLGDRIVRTLTIEGSVAWVGSSGFEVDGFFVPNEPSPPIVAISDLSLSVLHDSRSCGRPERELTITPDEYADLLAMIDRAARETHEANHTGALTRCPHSLCMLRAAVLDKN